MCQYRMYHILKLKLTTTTFLQAMILTTQNYPSLMKKRLSVLWSPILRMAELVGCWHTVPLLQYYSFLVTFFEDKNVTNVFYSPWVICWKVCSIWHYFSLPISHFNLAYNFRNNEMFKCLWPIQKSWFLFK
mgnify:CR=1 FL=1